MIELSGYDFKRVMSACAAACYKLNAREALRYIELRAFDGECIATAMDGFILQQIRVPCIGEGVVLIPGTVKPQKCEYVRIQDADALEISYLDEFGNLICANTIPKAEVEYIEWGHIVGGSRKEFVIHCDAALLAKAIKAAKYASSNIISISIPANEEEHIRIASDDAQMIVLPMRINDTSHAKRFENWYADVVEDEHEQD